MNVPIVIPVASRAAKAAACLCAWAMGLVAGGCGVKPVSTVEDLHRAVAAARAGDEIVLAAGVYRLRRTLRMQVPGVTLRGATGDRDLAVLAGGGMNNPRSVAEAILIEADDVTIRDLTIRDFYRHGLHIRAELDVDRTRIINLKTVNIGERHVKGSRGRRDDWADDVLIERLYMLQTERRLSRPGHPISPDNYIGGIDAMRCRNWIIRDCLARGIRGATGGGNAAIFLWNDVENVLIERNRILDCCKGIALGNPDGPAGRAYHAEGAVIRNNFILRSGDNDLNNIGIELCNVRNVKVLHNTLYSEDPAYVRTVHLFDEPQEALTENVLLAYNIIRGRIADNTVGGISDGSIAPIGWQAVGNVHGWKRTSYGPWQGTPVEPEWFADAGAGDFRLTHLAPSALRAAEPLAEVGDDVTGRKRPPGLRDVGAYQRRP